MASFCALLLQVAYSLPGLLSDASSSSYSHTNTIQLQFVLKRGLTIQAWLAWNALCRPPWHQTHGTQDTLTSASWGAGMKGVSHNSKSTRFSLIRLSFFLFELSRKLPLAHGLSLVKCRSKQCRPTPAIWLLSLPCGQNSWEASAHKPSRRSRFGGPGFNKCPPFPVTILRQLFSGRIYLVWVSVGNEEYQNGALARGFP